MKVSSQSMVTVKPVNVVVMTVIHSSPPPPRYLSLLMSSSRVSVVSHVPTTRSEKLTKRPVGGVTSLPKVPSRYTDSLPQ